MKGILFKVTWHAWLSLISFVLTSTRVAVSSLIGSQYTHVALWQTDLQQQHVPKYYINDRDSIQGKLRRVALSHLIGAYQIHTWLSLISLALTDIRAAISYLIGCLVMDIFNSKNALHILLQAGFYQIISHWINQHGMKW